MSGLLPKLRFLQVNLLARYLRNCMGFHKTLQQFSNWNHRPAQDIEPATVLYWEYLGIVERGGEWELENFPEIEQGSVCEETEANEN